MAGYDLRSSTLALERPSGVQPVPLEPPLCGSLEGYAGRVIGRVLILRRERNSASDPARFVLAVIKPIGQYRVGDVALGIQQQRDALRML